MTDPHGEHSLKTPTKKWIVLGCGWGFLLLGFLGLFLPILPGILFLIVGLLILSTEYLWASNLLAKLTARFPSFARHLEYAGERARRWTGERPPDST